MLYHRELNYLTYLYFIDTLYRYLKSINIFIITTLIKGGDDILYHCELNYIDLFDLRRSIISLRADLLRLIF